MSEGTAGGYNGRIARVNLTTGSVTSEPLSESLCRSYLGGAGFVSYYLLKELRPGIDPLSPDNKLIFALGPLTGLSLPGAGRHTIGAKSPLTGGFAKGEAGGFWGAELKRAGFDGLIVEGRAERPVYLWAHDSRVEIRDAGHLWGKSTKETQDTLLAELGDRLIRVSAIGPGGENLVRFAAIMSGLFDAAARGGLGAVMGSKNLKAIAVRGQKLPAVAAPDKVRELRQWLLENMRIMRGYQEFGTGVTMVEFEQNGNLPINNFRDGVFAGARQIDAETLKISIGIGMEGCHACPVRCKKVVRVTEPYTVDPAYGGPEYETLAGLGSNCGVDDLKAIAKGNELCGAYSLDTISTGGAIAFGMECFENGLITREDTGGLELRFGSAGAMLQAIELIARRQGIGDLLAEGTLRAARKLGGRAPEFAMQVKGLEAGFHEPKLKPGFGLGYMVGPQGADHCSIMFDERFVKDKQMRELIPLGISEALPQDDIGPKKVAIFKAIQIKRTLFDSLVLCTFLPYSFTQTADVVAGVTGWDTSVAEQLRVGERILTAARLFNTREGFSADDDRLPDRLMQPKRNGALANKALDPEKMARARAYYYNLMGWDARGVPLPERLEELGIA
ncbi:MAG: aldehyde ferredoxin oxidoreductase family protein [Chloroflexi bacterium]|nr:aldehyde ferredoxin oxidoreductase family protein [Chloroflexota bacterium]